MECTSEKRRVREHFLNQLHRWGEEHGREEYTALMRRLIKYSEKLPMPGFNFERIEKQLPEKAAVRGLDTFAFIDTMFAEREPEGVMRFLEATIPQGGGQ